MRILTAILMLAAAAPLSAQTSTTFSLTPMVRSVEKTDNQALVREYDSNYTGLSLDLGAKAVNSGSYLDLVLGNINGDENGGSLDMNLGDFVSVKGDVRALHHNHSFRPTGLDVNGVYNTQSAHDPTGMVDYTNGDMQSMKRVVTGINASVMLPKAGVSILPGFWQESETGATLSRHSSSNLKQDLDRRTQELSLGIGAGIGDGAIVADFTQRKFDDYSEYESTYQVNVPVDFRYAIRWDKNKTDLYDVRYRGNIGKMPVTALAMARTRTNQFNGFVSHAYTASVGGQYAVTRKLSVTAKFYDRTDGTVENDSFYGEGYTRGNPNTYDGTPTIDHYNFNGKLSAAYKYSDKLRFNAAYSYANEFRRHAKDHVHWYEEDTTYADGTVIPADTQYQGPYEKSQAHNVSFGVDADLPLDAALGLSYAGLFRDHAVMESMPTYQQNAGASLTLPLPANLMLTGSADYQYGKNAGSHMANDKEYQNTYLGDLNWNACSRFSMGVNYAYQKAKQYTDVYYGSENHSYQGTNYGVGNLIFLPDTLYTYNSNVYGYHATVDLAKGFSLNGDGSYSMTRANTPTAAQPLSSDSSGNTLSSNVGTDLTPMDVRMASGGVSLKYMYKDYMAKLGLSRSQWVDKLETINSGSANIISLVASARF